MFTSNSLVQKIAKELGQVKPDWDSLEDRFRAEQGATEKCTRDYLSSHVSNYFLTDYLKTAQSKRPHRVSVLDTGGERIQRKGFEFAYRKDYWLVWKDNKEYCKIQNIIIVDNLPVALDIRVFKRSLNRRLHADKLTRTRRSLKVITKKSKVGAVLVVPSNNVYPVDNQNQREFLSKGGVLVSAPFTYHEFRDKVKSMYRTVKY